MSALNPFALVVKMSPHPARGHRSQGHLLPAFHAPFLPQLTNANQSMCHVGYLGGLPGGPPPHPHPASLVTNSHPGVAHLPQVVNHADTTRLIEAPVVQAPLFVPPVLAQEPSRRTAWSPVVLPPRAPRSWAGRFLRLCWFRHFLTPSI